MGSNGLVLIREPGSVAGVTTGLGCFGDSLRLTEGTCLGEGFGGW